MVPTRSSMNLCAIGDLIDLTGTGSALRRSTGFPIWAIFRMAIISPRRVLKLGPLQLFAPTSVPHTPRTVVGKAGGSHSARHVGTALAEQIGAGPATFASF